MLKTDDVTTVNDDNLIAETFNDFFVGIGTKLTSETEGDPTNAYECDSVNMHQKPCKNITFNFSEIHPDEVINQLVDLKISN